MENKQIDILDILLILAKHKKFIVWTTLIASIAAVVYSLVVPFTWTSTAKILRVQQRTNNFSFNSSLLSMGANLLGGSLQSSNKDLITIMRSRTFSDDIINKFNLIEHFKITNSDKLVMMEKAIKALTSSVKIYEDNETGIITIEVTTEDKALSRDIANYYWQKLEYYNMNSRHSNAKMRREFIEKQLVEVENEIDKYSSDLEEFQSSNNLLELNKQIESIINIYSDMKAKEIALELDIEYNKLNRAANSLVVSSLENELSILRNKIETLKSNQPENSFLINLEEIPALALDYTKLLSKIQIQKTVYEFLYPQYEQARIDEVKDMPTIEVIDEAILAGQRTGPKRALICITVFVLTLLFTVLLSLLIDSFKAIDDGSIQSQKINEIRKYLKL